MHAFSWPVMPTLLRSRPRSSVGKSNNPGQANHPDRGAGRHLGAQPSSYQIRRTGPAAPNVTCARLPLLSDASDLTPRMGPGPAFRERSPRTNTRASAAGLPDPRMRRTSVSSAPATCSRRAQSGVTFAASAVRSLRFRCSTRPSCRALRAQAPRAACSRPGWRVDATSRGVSSRPRGRRFRGAEIDMPPAGSLLVRARTTSSASSWPESGFATGPLPSRRVTCFFLDPGCEAEAPRLNGRLLPRLRAGGRVTVGPARPSAPTSLARASGVADTRLHAGRSAR